MDRRPIYGYAQVFKRDWRLYSIPDGKHGRWPIPIAGGLPLRSLLYFGVTLVLMLLLDRVWIIGPILSTFSWPLQFLGVPVTVAILLTRLEPDGLSAVRFLSTTIASMLLPATTSAGRPVRPAGEPATLDELVAVAHDLTDARLPHIVVRGPARIAFADEVHVVDRTDLGGGRGRRVLAPLRRRHSAHVAARRRSQPLTDVALAAGEQLTIEAPAR